MNFYKYQGAGNDFIMIDNRDRTFALNTLQIAGLCNRHFGIGSDGLILLNPSSDFDFTMVYYNADGKQGSMCGNGGRCLVAFARDLGIVKKQATFDAVDGEHYATITNDEVCLKMMDVRKIKAQNTHCVLDTGSPHYVKMVKDIQGLDVVKKGAEIRYQSDFPDGINVNFVKKINRETFRVRTYERGVESETLACGTGVTAVALAMHHTKKTDVHQITLQAKGGILQVSFEPKAEQVYQNIFLKGNAKQVFKGIITL